MKTYILKRLLLIIPTLLGIMAINFAIIHLAPGGPVEQIIAKINNINLDATASFSGNSTEVLSAQNQDVKFNNKTYSSDADISYSGSRGLDPELIEQIEKMVGFDKPPLERFIDTIWRYLKFDFGNSFYKDQSVISLIKEKLPVSISLGIWTLLITYLVSIPLGIIKAIRDGNKFDVYSSAVIAVAYAIPGFLMAIFLIVLFAGGSFWQIFPLKGLTSPDFNELSLMGKILDYLWHIILPVFSLALGGFATLTMLTKNSFIEEINKQYVQTAKAKGATEKKVLYGHVFRNAMLIIIAGFPAAFIGVLFTGSLLIETIFSLDGLGLLSFEAVINRDYPIIFGSLYIFTLIGLLLNLLGDIMYVVVDPRIDFK